MNAAIVNIWEQTTTVRYKCMHWLPWMQQWFEKELTMLTGTWSQKIGPNLQPKWSDTDKITLRCKISSGSELTYGRKIERNWR